MQNAKPISQIHKWVEGDNVKPPKDPIFAGSNMKNRKRERGGGGGGRELTLGGENKSKKGNGRLMGIKWRKKSQRL